MSSALTSALGTKHIPSLDGLRAVAVLSVMFFHSFGLWGGRLGVSLFFVLSGFLITWLLLSEQEKHGSISLKNFYLRRTLRIFPAYYAFLALIVLIEVLQGQPEVFDHLVPALLYYINYFSAINESHPSFGHLWSLSVEEQFYLLWPFMFMVVIRFGRTHLIWFLIGAIVACLLWRCYAYMELGFSQSWMYRAFDTRFDNLAIGCLCAVLLRDANTRSIADRLLGSPWLLLVSIGLLFASSYPAHAYGLFDTYDSTFAFSVENILLALIMVQSIGLYQQPYMHWLQSRLFVFIGSISYPMYLYHEVAAGGSHKVFGLLERSIGFPKIDFLVGVLGFAATIALAYASYRVVEQPCLKLKERFSSAA